MTPMPAARGSPARHSVQQQGRHPRDHRGWTLLTPGVDGISNTVRPGLLTAVRWNTCGRDRARIALGSDRPRQEDAGAARWHGATAEAEGSGQIDQGVVEQRPVAIPTLEDAARGNFVAARFQSSRSSRALRATVHGRTRVWPTDRGAVGSSSPSLPPAGTRRRSRRGSCPWERARARPSRAAPAPREHLVAHGDAGRSRAWPSLEVRPHAGDGPGPCRHRP